MEIPTISIVNAESIPEESNIYSTQGAFIVQIEQGDFYIVKPQNEQHGLKIGPNELLGTLLGLEIGGPFLVPSLVRISQELLDQSGIREKSPEGQYIRPGLCFGIKYYSSIRDASYLDIQNPNIDNPEQTIPILILDSLIHNIDRANDGNIIIINSKKGSSTFGKKLIAIDQALAFGSTNWNVSHLSFIENNVRIEYYLDEIAALANIHSDKLDMYITKLENLSVSRIVWIIDQIPSEWGVTDDERQELFNFIQRRKRLIRHIFQDAFPLQYIL